MVHVTSFGSRRSVCGKGFANWNLWTTLGDARGIYPGGLGGALSFRLVRRWV